MATFMGPGTSWTPVSATTSATSCTRPASRPSSPTCPGTILWYRTCIEFRLWCQLKLYSTTGTSLFFADRCVSNSNGDRISSQACAPFTYKDKQYGECQSSYTSDGYPGPSFKWCSLGGDEWEYCGPCLDPPKESEDAKVLKFFFWKLKFLKHFWK